MLRFSFTSLVAGMAMLPAAAVLAQSSPAESVPPEATEVWEPVPATVDTSGHLTGGEPPQDAIVLFDGSGLGEWENVRDASAAGWEIVDGVLRVNKAAGSIRTRRVFGSYQLHLEWRVPAGTTGSGQSRGNSGLFMASTGAGDRGYELQILDSWNNETYVNGMAGAIYKQSIPLVNASRPPGQWQSYDVIWTAPSFDASGALVAPARVTALYNGVLVQNDFELAGETVYIGSPRYQAHGESPIALQAHGDPSPPISFRNIWVRPLD